MNPYEPINFVDGERLRASDLNKMDDQLVHLTQEISGVDTILDLLIDEQQTLIRRGADL